MEIIRGREKGTLRLSQQAYADLVTTFGMADENPVKIPMESNLVIDDDPDPNVDVKTILQRRGKPNLVNNKNSSRFGQSGGGSIAIQHSSDEDHSTTTRKQIELHMMRLKQRFAYALGPGLCCPKTSGPSMGWSIMALWVPSEISSGRRVRIPRPICRMNSW